MLYLTDAHVSRAASKAIADWVQKGGRLFATAWAGTSDEYNQPNKVLRELLGVTPVGLVESPGSFVRREKEDLPFANPADLLTLKDGEPSACPAACWAMSMSWSSRAAVTNVARRATLRPFREGQGRRAGCTYNKRRPQARF